MENLLLRPPQLNELPDISALYAQSWKETYRGLMPQAYLDDLRDDAWVEKFSQMLQNGPQKLLAAFEGNTPLGAVCFGPAREQSLLGWGEVVSIYVHPHAWGKGVGSRLFTAACESLQQMGCQKLYLWYLSGNERARRFYERHGFVKTPDTLQTMVQGMLVTDIRMEKTLLPPGLEKR